MCFRVCATSINQLITREETYRRKLALLVPSLGDGGSNRFMIELARGLATRERPVDLIAIDPSGQYAGLEIENVNNVGLGTIPIRGLTVIATVIRLVRYMHFYRPNLVMSVTTPLNNLLILASLIARSGARIIVSERSAIRVSGHYSSIVSRIHRRLIPLTYRKADEVIAVTNGVADELVRDFRLNQQQVRVMYNPIVSVDLIRKSEYPVGDPWFCHDGVPTIMSVGRLHPSKDFSTLIKAFARMLKTREARMVIFGEGPLRRDLEGLITKLGLEARVKLPGFMDNPYSYMANAQLFVVSSIYEGICNVLVEALACGCPVVATDCPGGGPREILEGGKWGKLIPVGDEQAICNAMLETIDDPPDSTALKLRAQFFSTELRLREYQEFLTT